MRIAIHAADLDCDRIDGTRVYLHNILKWFGEIGSSDNFLIYHGKKFNPSLAPSKFKNYYFKSLKKMPVWTQSVFAWNIKKDQPSVLWMPVHNIPFFKSKKIPTVVTIHDLAFKYFPQYFPLKDLFKLNILAKIAITRADKIIAISQSTKEDILRFYPKISEEKITVIYHGFDGELFQKEISSESVEKMLNYYNLTPKSYLLYVGAIQPRKNLGILIEAFEKIKPEKKDLKLVLAGAPAWMHEQIMEKIKSSEYVKDIIVTGTTSFETQPILYQNAAAFVFPSLYEGFGIPILEAMASGTPVVCQANSSLQEVAGGAALYFKGYQHGDLEEKINTLLEQEDIAEEFRQRGKERIKLFSWQKCAQETLKILKDSAKS